MRLVLQALHARIFGALFHLELLDVIFNAGRARGEVRMRAKTWLIVALLLSGWSIEVAAENNSPDYSPYYNGSFVEFSVRGAYIADEDPAKGIDVGLRHSFPMLLLDSRLSWRGDWMAQGMRHTVHYGFGLHPLYIVLLGNSWLAYTISSIYLELGAGLEIHDYDPTDLGMALTVGGGLDIPLWDADAGHAPWLNLLYRYHASSFSNVGDDSHLIFVGLAWRRNGLLF